MGLKMRLYEVAECDESEGDVVTGSGRCPKGVDRAPASFVIAELVVVDR